MLICIGPEINKLVTFDTVDSLKPTDKNNLTESGSLIVRLTLYNENFKIFNKRKKKINNKPICVFFFFPTKKTQINTFRDKRSASCH